VHPPFNERCAQYFVALDMGLDIKLHQSDKVMLGQDGSKNLGTGTNNAESRNRMRIQPRQHRHVLS
jgi:hypothetical protein